MQTDFDVTLQQITTAVSQHLINQKLSMVSAESCTGGWVAKCCTDMAGSSAWFERGFVTYSNQSKQDLLNVSSATLEQFGAVSEQTVIEMAKGALANSIADICVAITGIAGPDGGNIEKPVGTVWIAWATKKSSVKAQRYLFKGDRAEIRRQAVIAGLQGIIKNARG